MRLIGMLDSPYVRRVAITLQLLDLPFEHQSLSVFRTFTQFQRINPVVKAPTLIADDGTVIMESTLMIEYAESLAHPRSLRPKDADALLHDLRRNGLALAVCDRSVNIIYEHLQRPPEKRHGPWVERVTGQLLAACGELEGELQRSPIVVSSSALTQGSLSVAVAWNFVQQMIPQIVPGDRFPHLQALSLAAERLPEFAAAPHGDGTFSG